MRLIWRCRHTDACSYNNGINTRGCFLACSREDGRPPAYPGGWGRLPLASPPRGAPPAGPGPRPPSHLGYLSQRLLSTGSVPGAGPGSRDAGPHVSEADASLHLTLWCSCKQMGGWSAWRRGRGEPKQTGRAPGGSRAWGRPRPAAGVQVGT